MRHSCSVSSSTGLTSPYRPTLRPASFWPLIDVLTQMRSPQTIGLDRPRPGIAVFQATPRPLATSQDAGSGKPFADAGGADAAELRPVDAGLRVCGSARIESVGRSERQRQHGSRGPESQIHELLLRDSDASRITAVGYTGRGSRGSSALWTTEVTEFDTKQRGTETHEGPVAPREARAASDEGRANTKHLLNSAVLCVGPPLVRCHSPAVRPATRPVCRSTHRDGLRASPRTPCLRVESVASVTSCRRQQSA